MQKAKTELESAGFLTLPVGSAKKKAPCVSGWNEPGFQWDPATVGCEGIGILTGERSSLTVIDFDDLHKREPATEHEQAQYEELLDTLSEQCSVIVKTQNGGQHLYFQYDAGLKQTQGYIKGVDVRNDGGYVVAPPTPGYQFIKGACGTPLLPLPLADIERIVRKETVPGKPGALIGNDEIIGIGHRDERIFKHLLSACASGIPIDDAVADVMNKNIAWDQEWDERKVREKARHVYQKYPAPAKDKKDSEHGDVPTMFENLLDIESIRKTLRTVRAAKMDAVSKKENYAAIVLGSLKSRGVFLHANEKQSKYYFKADDKNLIRLHDRDSEFRLLLSEYLLNATDPFFAYVSEELQMHACKHGMETTVHIDCYYDEGHAALYISNHDNLIYKVTPGAIEPCDNGTDGILFLAEPEKEPFIFQTPTGTGGKLKDVILDQFNFADDHTLNRAEQSLLLKFYLLYLFFCKSGQDRPILVLVGEKGSTKTVNARKVVRLRYGNRSDVTSVSKHKEDDFDTTLINSKLLVLDNVDSRIPWLDDKLALVATGGNLARRKLFTTDTLCRYPVDCHVIITSRTPRFCRDDVADRLLMLKTERPEAFRNKQSIDTELSQNRNIILSELIIETQRILSILCSDKCDIDTSFRIADFASFCLKIARHDGNELQVKTIFDKMQREQSRFTLEGYAGEIMDLLEEWVDMDDNCQRFVTNKELCHELSELVVSRGLEFSYKNKHRPFGQKMSQIRSNLSEFFNVMEGPKSGNNRSFRYSKLNMDLF